MMKRQDPKNGVHLMLGEPAVLPWRSDNLTKSPPSTIMTSSFGDSCSKTWTSPAGQRMVRRATDSAAPSPNTSCRWLLTRYPSPPMICRVHDRPPASTVTVAPIASRLLNTPRSCTAKKLPGSGVVLVSSAAGASRWVMHTSSRPSRFQSKVARALPK